MATTTTLLRTLLAVLATVSVTSVRHQSVNNNNNNNNNNNRPTADGDWPHKSSSSSSSAAASGVSMATTSGVRGSGISTVREFCDWETANATCRRRDELVVIRSARYGRLRLNRCAAKSYGNLGCGADVTALFAGTCSGRPACHVAVISLHGIRTTCPSDLKAYVELTYDCVKGWPPVFYMYAESLHEVTNFLHSRAPVPAYFTPTPQSIEAPHPRPKRMLLIQPGCNLRSPERVPLDLV